MDEALETLMEQFDKTAEALEARYKQRIETLESEIAEQKIGIRWGWTLAKTCSFNHKPSQCGKTGGACRPGSCPLIE